MKKGILALLIGAVSMAIIGLISMIKSRGKKLEKEDENIMNTILANQKELEAACRDQDEMVQNTIKMIDELRERLNQPDYGVDPRTIDVRLEDVGA